MNVPDLACGHRDGKIKSLKRVVVALLQTGDGQPLHVTLLTDIRSAARPEAASTGDSADSADECFVELGFSGGSAALGERQQSSEHSAGVAHVRTLPDVGDVPKHPITSFTV